MPDVELEEVLGLIQERIDRYRPDGPNRRLVEELKSLKTEIEFELS
jgi:hypothetical protein